MKKVLLLSAIAFASCGKFNLDKRIQGTWNFESVKMSTSNEWFIMPSTESPVIITENFVHNPWNKSYNFIGKDKIQMDSITFNVTISKHKMLWVSNSNDSLRFTR